MKKIPTYFKKDPTDLSRVINEVPVQNRWVGSSICIASQKFDGTACAIKDGQLYKRYDVKKGREVPPYAIPCQEPDEVTGHWPHWVLCQPENPADKYHFEAFNRLEEKTNGTYELCGEKVQGNPECIIGHKLLKHGEHIVDIFDYSFEGLKEFLRTAPMEGLVFYNITTGDMCKIRKSDFGFKRQP